MDDLNLPGDDSEADGHRAEQCFPAVGNIHDEVSQVPTELYTGSGDPQWTCTTTFGSRTQDLQFLVT